MGGVKETSEDVEHQDVLMEDTSDKQDKGKQVASEVQEPEQQIVISENQTVAGTSFGEIPGVILKTFAEKKEENDFDIKRLDRQDLLFEMNLSRLSLPPPPHNPNP